LHLSYMFILHTYITSNTKMARCAIAFALVSSPGRLEIYR